MKIASLIDFPKPTLDSNVWDLNRNILNPVCKDFIVRILNTFIESRNLKASEQWITDITLVGSICTYLWNSQSDIDVHVKVDVNKFKETNVPEMTEEKAAEYLDQLRKELDVAKLLLPLSNGHVVEYYFETKFHPANVSRVGVYSIFMNKWLKTPPPVPQDFDIEKIKPRIVEEATEVALGLDENFSKVKQNLVRIEDLMETLKAWPREKQQLYIDKINDKISKIEEEIKKALQVKEDLVTERHKKQDPLSDNELIFKWLQHMSYFSILSNLKTLLEQTGGEISTTELPLIDKIISQGTIKEAVLDHSWWISPDGEIFDLDDANDHQEWMQEYGPDFEGRDPIEEGWIRVRLGKNEIDISIKNLNNIPQFLDSFILNYPKLKIFIDSGIDDVSLDYNEAVTNGVQKAVNKALSQKRMGSLEKQAYGDWMGAGWWIDPNGQVHDLEEGEEHDEWMSEHKHLDPSDENDWDELMGQGWIRARKFGGEDKLTLEVGSIDNIPDYVNDFILAHPAAEVRVEGCPHNLVEIPYDLVVSKGIQKAVALSKRQPLQSSVKEARLIGDTYYGGKLWFDPSGQVYEVGSSGSHADWILNNVQMLKDKYGFDSSKWTLNSEGDIPNFETLDNALISFGWARVGDTHMGWGIQISDLRHVPEYFTTNYLAGTSGSIIFEDLSKNWVEVDVESFITQGQKAVNRALSQKRMGSIKEAFLKEAFEKQILAIDFDDTIAHENPDKTIGEPEAGVKEALTKLRDDGYTLEIYSHRANDEKGADEIKEWLDSHEIPYDSILNVEKPLAKFYIDNRGIHFTNWADVLKQVEKSDKTASLTKESEMLEFDGIDCPILVNPSLNEAIGYLNKSKAHELRFIEWVDLYMWDAYYADHYDVMKHISGRPYEGQEATAIVKTDKEIKNLFRRHYKTASLHIVAYNQQKLWIDPNGKEYKVGTSHADWILEHEDMLEAEYGWKNTGEWKFEDGGEIYDFEGLDASLVDMGWSRVGDIYGGGGWGIEVADLFDVPDYLIDKLIGKHGTSNKISYLNPPSTATINISNS